MVAGEGGWYGVRRTGEGGEIHTFGRECVVLRRRLSRGALTAEEGGGGLKLGSGLIWII